MGAGIASSIQGGLANLSRQLAGRPTYPGGTTQLSSVDGTNAWLVILDPNKIYLPKNSSRTYDRIQFRYMHDGFSESKSANYSSTQILGRSEPIRGYLGSTPKVFNIQLSIPVEGDDLPGTPPVATAPQPKQQTVDIPGQGQNAAVDSNGIATFSTTKAIYDDNPFKRKWEVEDFIRSLVYPHYSADSQGITYPPPRVLLVIGVWFSIIGLVSSWSMTHKSPYAAGPGLSRNMTPYLTEVNLSIEEASEPYSFQDVYTGLPRVEGRKSIERGGVQYLPLSSF